MVFVLNRAKPIVNMVDIFNEEIYDIVFNEIRIKIENPKHRLVYAHYVMIGEIVRPVATIRRQRVHFIDA